MNKYKSFADDSLVGLYKAGDPNAFDELLRRYDADVHTYLRLTVKNKDDAEDLFQDIFIKMMKNILDGNYKAEGYFKAWLMRMTQNSVIDYFRRSNVITKNIVNHNVSEEAANALSVTIENLRSHDLTIDEVMQREETFSALYRLITMLPPLQREVVMLRYWGDLSFKEIADVTGVSINTALGRMRYALKALKQFSKKTAEVKY